MYELAIFAGIGGGILATQQIGFSTICAIEQNPFCASILAQRQNDGQLEPFPIWSDVRTFDPGPFKGAVDLISGGFPCQDISIAGRGQGISGEKSSLWKSMFSIIREIRPFFVFVENSPEIASRGLGVVLGNLAQAGYHAAWGVYSAAEIGANHRRKRMWILAANGSVRRYRSQNKEICTRRNTPFICDWWKAEPGIRRVDDGVPNRVDRVRALGNAIVPRVAAFAFFELLDVLESYESDNCT